MEILEKKVLLDSFGTRIIRLEIKSPLIAAKVEAGQFVVLMVNAQGERIPLTVVDQDKEKGTISLIFQEVGFTTKLLGKLNVHDCLFTLAGPLGHPTEIRNYGKVILVGGGVGIAEIYPVAKALKQKGNYLITLLGARTKWVFILEKELKEFSDEVYTATDDGSYGEKGFVTDILSRLLNRDKYDLAYAVGPIAMMEKVASVTQPFNLKTLVSLNALMVDATGMCGCCRVNIAGKVKFSCVDGPEFDAHLVDWEELKKRNNIYKDKEQHICNLNK
jgi:ferredoxin--NADP+ reductase